MIAAYPRLKPWAMISRPLRGGTPDGQRQFVASFHWFPRVRSLSNSESELSTTVVFSSSAFL